MKPGTHPPVFKDKDIIVVGFKKLVTRIVIEDPIKMDSLETVATNTATVFLVLVVVDDI